MLTEEEYIQLKEQAEESQYSLVEIHLLNVEIKRLNSNYKELEAKYNRLLVFGVTASNERLRNKSTKQKY